MNAGAEQLMQTERLNLEPLVLSHAKEMYPNLQDPRLYRYISGGPPASVDALTKRYNILEGRRSPDGKELWLNWILRTKTENSCIGYIQASIHVDEKNYATIAYVLFPNFWGQGYAREGMIRVISQLLEGFDASEIEAFVDTRNTKSIQLLQFLGFNKVAFIKDADFIQGASSDEFRYILLPSTRKT